MKTILKTISRINNIEIKIVEKDEEYYVPIRPICDALGVDFSAQRQRLERDEIVAPTVVMITTVAEDNKEREMLCIPLMYVWGWLLSIDVSRVKEEAKEMVIAYKKECHFVLYNHFMGQYITLDKQIKETARRKARINAIKEDLAANPTTDERVIELMQLEAIQTKEARLPYSKLGKKMKEEYQFVLNFK